MADLMLNLLGNSSGATQALQEVHHEAGALHEMLEGAVKGALGNYVSALTSWEAAGEKVVDIVKESIQEFAKAESAHRQLAFVAKENTEAFEKQAQAISASFAVKDEDVEHMQTMLLRYGAAPNIVGAATQAILNFSAATGQDANGAMMMLIRGVESGSGSLGRMGVHFDATGNQAHDFASAVEALNEKFGGAGETEADGLTGRMRHLDLAIEDTKKAFGGFFALLEEKTHVLDFVASSLSKGWSGATGATLRLYQSLGLLKGPTAKEEVPTVQGEAKGGVEMTIGAVSISETEESRLKRIHEKEADEQRIAEQERFNKRMIKESEDFDLQQDQLRQKQLDHTEKEIAESNDLMMKAFEGQEKEHTKDLEQIGAMQAEMAKHQTDDMAKELTRRTQLWANAGQQIGKALIDGIFSIIQQATSGGNNTQSDQAKQGIKITQGLFNMVFSLFGMGWLSSSAFGAMNAGDSGGAGAGFGAFSNSFSNVRFSGGGTSGFSNQQMAEAGYSPPPEQHGGGWIQRFHDGGWPMRGDESLIIAQHGERMLSRREVARMGGPSGVEAAVSGGGGRTMVVQAFDSTSMLSFFGGRGSDAMISAMRANIGPLRLALGKGF